MVFFGFFFGVMVFFLSFVGSGFMNCMFVIFFRIVFVSFSLSLICVVFGMDCGFIFWDVFVVVGWLMISVMLWFVMEFRLLFVIIGLGLFMLWGGMMRRFWFWVVWGMLFFMMRRVFFMVDWFRMFMMGYRGLILMMGFLFFMLCGSWWMIVMMRRCLFMFMVWRFVFVIVFCRDVNINFGRGMILMVIMMGGFMVMSVFIMVWLLFVIMIFVFFIVVVMSGLFEVGVEMFLIVFGLFGYIDVKSFEEDVGC